LTFNEEWVAFSLMNGHHGMEMVNVRVSKLRISEWMKFNNSTKFKATTLSYYLIKVVFYKEVCSWSRVHKSKTSSGMKYILPKIPTKDLRMKQVVIKYEMLKKPKGNIGQLGF
jgi:hypothetical protein